MLAARCTIWPGPCVEDTVNPAFATTLLPGEPGISAAGSSTDMEWCGPFPSTCVGHGRLPWNTPEQTEREHDLSWGLLRHWTAGDNGGASQLGVHVEAAGSRRRARIVVEISLPIEPDHVAGQHEADGWKAVQLAEVGSYTIASPLNLLGSDSMTR